MKSDYDGLIHDNMTRDEISNLGVIIIKDKIRNMKEKISSFFFRKER